MNLNLSASISIFKLLAKPSLCLPHATVATFNDLPLALGELLAEKGKKVDIRAVVLDKDDCFAYPERSEIFEAYKVFLPCFLVGGWAIFGRSFFEFVFLANTT